MRRFPNILSSSFTSSNATNFGFGVLLLHNEIILYCFPLTNTLSDVAVSVNVKCSCLPARLDYYICNLLLMRIVSGPSWD